MKELQFRNKLTTGRPSQKELALSELQKDEDPFSALNLRIPRSFHKKIKQRAVEDNISMTDLICAAIMDYMKK